MNSSCRSAGEAASTPTSGESRCNNHRRSGSSGETAASSFPAATCAESDSRIPASALTISPNAQNVIPSPYGRQRPCRHRVSSGFVPR